ncbi:4-carboxymuconolactone decarboxylase [Desulfosarcina alkanivorans]|uniref:4-carboxymuconolactone decarboxylase n=1 Tax=Desulfosarcina alkanivorans TaxID=571177 RepID=A0A5K7YSX2_9BACT|nr:carboxymuconolactone decarboxylase family protein [Desulfosarcina alkanivorans]BBO71495.1 4-carboxymuconolactone decarboxylase [Desulfosarcina alkanivorans]
MSEQRYETGLKTLKKITASSGAAVIDGLKDLAPDLADWIIKFSYGDVLSRPHIDLKSRQLATVAALTAMGTATPQLKVHIKGALNVGCKQEEIVEIILQMAVFAGFPAAINGINASREVFEKEESP